MAQPERPRLTQIVLSLGAGGTERLVIDLCLALAPQADVQVLCLDEPGAWAGQLVDSGVPVRALGRRPGFDHRLLREVRTRVARHRSAVVHCHHYTPFVYGRLATLRLRGVRVVYTEHGRLSDAPWSAKRKLANAVLGRLPGRCFAVSRELRDYMIAGGLPPSRVGVIYNGVPPGPPPDATRREALRRELGIDRNARVIGTVARLDPVKDLGTLIDAFAALARAGDVDRLLLVGDGPERAALEARTRRLEVDSQVTFMGQRDDARRLLDALDIYVNSSITEGVSVTILEAMAAGLPVVATAVGVTPEVIEDGGCGLLVSVSSTEAVIRTVRRLLQDRALAGRLGQSARSRIEARFATETMLARYVNAYGLGDPGEQHEECARGTGFEVDGAGGTERGST